MHQLRVEDRGSGGTADRVMAEGNELVSSTAHGRSRPIVTAIPLSRFASSDGCGRFCSVRYTKRLRGRRGLQLLRPAAKTVPRRNQRGSVGILIELHRKRCRVAVLHGDAMHARADGYGMIRHCSPGEAAEAVSDGFRIFRWLVPANSLTRIDLLIGDMYIQPDA
jgi:hypothetical protein